MVVNTEVNYIKWYSVDERPTPPTNIRLLVAVKSGCVFIAQKQVWGGWFIWTDDKKVNLERIDPVEYWAVLPDHPAKEAK